MTPFGGWMFLLPLRLPSPSVTRTHTATPYQALSLPTLRLPSPSVTRTHRPASRRAPNHETVETPIPVGDEDAPPGRDRPGVPRRLRLPSPSVTRTHAPFSRAHAFVWRC